MIRMLHKCVCIKQIIASNFKSKKIVEYLDQQRTPLMSTKRLRGQVPRRIARMTCILHDVSSVSASRHQRRLLTTYTQNTENDIHVLDKKARKFLFYPNKTNKLISRLAFLQYEYLGIKNHRKWYYNNFCKAHVNKLINKRLFFKITIIIIKFFHSYKTIFIIFMFNH